MAVPSTLKLMSDIQGLALSITALAKGGKIGILQFPQLLDLVTQLTVLAEDLPAALTELKTLSAVDLGTLTTAGYNVVEAELVELGVKLPSAPEA